MLITLFIISLTAAFTSIVLMLITDRKFETLSSYYEEQIDLSADAAYERGYEAGYDSAETINLITKHQLKK